MAEASDSIFNKNAAKKLHDPDELDKYVRIMNPSVIVILVACIALLAGILAWGVFGTVATSVSAKGAVIDGRAVCFLPAEEIEKVNVGNEAMVGGRPMTVSKLSALPLSPCSADGDWPCCLWRCFSSSGPALTQPFAWRSARFCS